jgi:DNA-binding transcriptional ArsR family regulator
MSASGSASKVAVRNGRSRKTGDTPLDRALHALNHPIRRRILRELSCGEGSAKTLARAMGMELGVVSYHLNQVLARECDVVEMTDSVPRRGAVEKFYRLRGEMLAGVAPDFGSPVDGNWEWSLALVDSAAWEEIRAARADFNRRVGAAVEESQERGEMAGAQAVVVGTATFPALHPGTSGQS